MSTKETRQDELAAIESELRQTLDCFRENVQAWSEVAGRQPRSLASASSAGWRRALGWAVGCVVVVAGAGGVVRIQRHAPSAVIAPQMAMSEKAVEAEPAQPLPQSVPGPVRVERARQQVPQEDLLAKVDSDVSRQIPEVLEPLAQWTEDGEP